MAQMLTYFYIISLYSQEITWEFEYDSKPDKNKVQANRKKLFLLRSLKLNA